MNHSLSPLKKFKHDTIGKFTSIKELIETFEEDNLYDSETQEILVELKETFIKMSKATDRLIKSDK